MDEIEVVEVEPRIVPVEDCSNVHSAAYTAISFIAAALGIRVSQGNGGSSLPLPRIPSASPSASLSSSSASSVTAAAPASTKTEPSGEVKKKKKKDDAPAPTTAPVTLGGGGNDTGDEGSDSSGHGEGEDGGEGDGEDGGDSDAEERALEAGLAIDPEPEAAAAGARKCLTTSDIVREQERMVRDIAEIMSVDRGIAAAMLRKHRWRRDALLDAFIKNPQQVFAEVGSRPRGDSATRTKQQQPPADHSSLVPAPAAPLAVPPGAVCIICAEPLVADKASALSCKHWACNDCWSQFLTLKIQEGQACFITCPAHKCSCVVPQELVQARVAPELFLKYTAFLTKSFVDHNPDVKWCPAPGCGNALKAEQCHRGVGYCTCGYRSCWTCRLEDHMPASCAEIDSWKKKCSDDSETIHWIMTNTRNCPKCRSPIEKNAGCNHTCRQCKHEFCWVCQGEWKGHTNFYSCNRFEEKQKKKKVTKSQKAKEQQLEESRLALEKYLHYYHRFVNHELSSKFEVSQRERSAKRMLELRETDSEYRDVQFIMDATEGLLDCRRALRNSYVHAYYLPEGHERQLFEMLQSDLEKSTERLSEILEQPLEKLNRVDTKNLTSLCKVQLKNLLDSVDSDPASPHVPEIPSSP